MRHEIEVQQRKQLHNTTSRAAEPELIKDQNPLTAQFLHSIISIRRSLPTLTNPLWTIGQWRSIKNTSLSLSRLAAIWAHTHACFRDCNHFHPCFNNPISAMNDSSNCINRILISLRRHIPTLSLQEKSTSHQNLIANPPHQVNRDYQVVKNPVFPRLFQETSSENLKDQFF